MTRVSPLRASTPPMPWMSTRHGLAQRHGTRAPAARRERVLGRSERFGAPDGMRSKPATFRLAALAMPFFTASVGVFT